MFKFLMLGLLSCFLISGFTLAEDKPTEESLDKEKIIAVIDAQCIAVQASNGRLSELHQAQRFHFCNDLTSPLVDARSQSQ